MISLEAINNYETEIFSNYKITKNYDLLLENFITIYQKIKKHNNKASYNFLEMLQYLYVLHKSIKNRLVLKLTLNIFNKNQLSIKSKEITQYTRKFTYIYFTKYKHYYESHKFLYLFELKNIHEMAIINLYILYLINTLKYKKSIYFFIKYLYI